MHVDPGALRVVAWDFDGVLNRNIENGVFAWSRQFEADLTHRRQDNRIRTDSRKLIELSGFYESFSPETGAGSGGPGLRRPGHSGAACKAG